MIKMERYEKEFYGSMFVLAVILGLIVFAGFRTLGGSEGASSVKTHNDAGTGFDAGDSRETAIELKNLNGETIPGGLGREDNSDFFSFNVENGRTMSFKIFPEGPFTGQISAALLPPDDNSPVASTGEVETAKGGEFVYTLENSGTYLLKVEAREGFNGSYLFRVSLDNLA